MGRIPLRLRLLPLTALAWIGLGCWGVCAAMPPVSQPRPESLELVAQEADKHTRSAFDLAGRGAYFAARAEFIAALRLVAQGLDSVEGTARHSQALADAWVAIREIEDFVPRGGRLEADLDLPAIIRTHRTPVLRDSCPRDLTSLDAIRSYLTFAQQQLSLCAEHEVAGSMALHGLGKLHATLARQPDLHVACAEGIAMTCFQAALVVYPDNYMAANELGVLLARGGCYADARIALEHSVATYSHASGWRNLAVVNRRLGEDQLAEQAEQKSQILESQSRSGKTQLATQPVQWIDPETFAQSFADTSAAKQPFTNTTASPPTPERRTASRWWPFDKTR